MDFKTFSPPDILKPFVKYFYFLNSNDVVKDKKIFRTVADGCPGILFQKNSEGRFYREEKELPGTFLFGQSTKHTDLLLTGSFNAVGVYLKPQALNTIFGLNAELLTDTCLDLSTHGKGKEFQLLDRLEYAESHSESIDVLTTYLIKEYEKNNAKVNADLQYAVDKILGSQGTIEIKCLLRELNLSERTFERRFKQFIGISPKLFSRICRFQSSIKQLNSNDFFKLSDIAYDNNYADQSHFIRSFKEFSGLSPYQYQKQSSEIVDNLSELIF